MMLETITLFSWLALQAPVTPVAPDTEPAPPAVEPYGGDLNTGLAEVKALAMEDKYDESLALSERLLAPTGLQNWVQGVHAEDSFFEPLVTFVEPALESVGLLGAPPTYRAEVHYARGVVLMRRGKHDSDANLREAADSEYQAARRLAGPGELRQASVYNLGVGWLEEAELVRIQIPEVRERLGLPALPPTTPPASGSASGAAEPEEPPDPLDIARGFYLKAREHLVERLQLDWRDADTRANVELILRRLRELDEIEKQREEQEQQESEQQGEENPKDKPEGEPEQNPDEQEQPEQQQDPQEGEPQEPEQQGEPEPEPEPEQTEGEEPEPAQSEEEPQGEPEERVLTREEVMRLLEQLKQLEKESEAIQEQLRDKRRVPVKRDW